MSKEEDDLAALKIMIKNNTNLLRNKLIKTKSDAGSSSDDSEEDLS